MLRCFRMNFHASAVRVKEATYVSDKGYYAYSIPTLNFQIFPHSTYSTDVLPQTSPKMCFYHILCCLKAQYEFA